LENPVNENTDNPLKRTPLYDLHVELGGKVVPFAGYELPVQYEGIMAEHQHTREHAGLFDVSHMGQALLYGDDAAAAMESLVPGDLRALAPGKMRYTLLTNDQGGIRDDLIVTNMGDHLFLVVNADCKDADFAHIRESLKGRAELEILTDRALLALQGPKAGEVLARFAPDSESLTFMTAAEMDVAGVPCFVTRSGYTGEDGFEISVPEAEAANLARTLLAEDEVAPIGLGARDSLRLEAGLCLYGSDIDVTTTPVEAGLTWAINKRRREEGGFPGAEIILGQLADGVARKRVGILPDGRAPARAHTEIRDKDGNPIGEITSGGFGPTFGGPVAMGYVQASHAGTDTAVDLMVRGKAMPGRVAAMPFVAQRYKK